MQKLSSGKEHGVQVIRDEYSGWVRAYPMFNRDAANVTGNILSFLGPVYDNPFVMVKSDQAAEPKLACKQLACAFEGSLENRFLHNAVLERDIRTLQGVTSKQVSTLVPDLWIYSVEFAAKVECKAHRVRKY